MTPEQATEHDRHEFWMANHRSHPPNSNFVPVGGFMVMIHRGLPPGLRTSPDDDSRHMITLVKKTLGENIMVMRRQEVLLSGDTDSEFPGEFYEWMAELVSIANKVIRVMPTEEET